MSLEVSLVATKDRPAFCCLGSGDGLGLGKIMILHPVSQEAEGMRQGLMMNLLRISHQPPLSINSPSFSR